MDLQVIFRKEYDPYMEIWKWLAVFPTETDWRGNMQCISFYDVQDGTMFDNHSECCPEYYHKTKTIKDKKILEELKSKLERYYNSLPGEEINLVVRLKRKL